MSPSSQAADVLGRPDEHRAHEYVTDAQEAEAVMVFRIGHCHLAVSASSVLHVDALHEAVPLARAPAWIEGLVPIASGAVPLVDLHRFVPLRGVLDADQGMETASAPSQHRDDLPGRVLIVEQDGMRVGFRSDRVLGIVLVPRFATRDATRGQKISEFVRGEHETPFGLVLCLDLEKLLPASRLR